MVKVRVVKTFTSWNLNNLELEMNKYILDNKIMSDYVGIKKGFEEYFGFIVYWQKVSDDD